MVSSFSMAAFEAVVCFSSSMYCVSDCCMLAKESRSRRTSSLCLMAGSGVSKFPLATSSADAANCFRGLVARRMECELTSHTSSTASRMRNTSMPPTR